MKINRRRMDLVEYKLVDIESGLELETFDWADIEAGEFGVTDMHEGQNYTISAKLALIPRKEEEDE